MAQNNCAWSEDFTMKSFKKFIRDALRLKTSPFEPGNVFIFASNDKIGKRCADPTLRG